MEKMHQTLKAYKHFNNLPRNKRTLTKVADLVSLFF